MSGAAWRALLLLPSIDRFLGDLADDLVNNRSVVLLLPKGTEPEDVSELVADELFKRNVSYLNYAVPPGQTARLTPETVAADMVKDASGASRSLINLWQGSSFPEVILLENADHSENHWREILILMRQWAEQIGHSTIELPGPRTLFAPCRATCLLGDLP